MLTACPSLLDTNDSKGKMQKAKCKSGIPIIPKFPPHRGEKTDHRGTETTEKRSFLRCELQRCNTGFDFCLLHFAF